MTSLVFRSVRAVAVTLCVVLSACGGESAPVTTPPVVVTPPVVLPVAATLTVTSGNDQTGNLSATLGTTLSVKALTSAGAPVAGSEIVFAVASGTATVSPGSALTDVNGEAFARLTLGAVAGFVQVNATVKGTAVTTMFRATSVVAERDSTSAPAIYNPDWTEASHGQVTPNYVTTFPQTAVNTLEITLTTTQWASIRADMTKLYGFDFGARRGVGGGFPEDDPDYVAAPVKYNGKTWKKVGFRLKGNSTLTSAWGDGNYKLPFRLNLDSWEDTYPAIKNQRFYGFKELSFSPGRSDPSLIREKSMADLLRLAGVPAAQTAFYRVFIDFGQGLKYCGLYTAVEVIDDTMVKDQFGEDKGNIYKPESNFRTFVETQFEKKNNKTGAFTDVQTFITELNSPLRMTDAAQWRRNLENVFNVDHFLKWLAVNNTLVNWDVYGAIAHNYYLYNSPTKKLTWIPWDHNEALTGSPGITGTVGGGGGGGGGVGPGRGLSFSMNEVAVTWPLLRYVADDSVYVTRYKSHLKTFNTTVLSPATVGSMFERYTALISPFVIGANGEQPGYTYTSAAQFNAALPALKAHIDARKALVTTFVP